MSEKQAPCMEYIGDWCPNCEITHRVIESLPQRPATDQFVAQLEQQDEIKYVSGVAVVSRDEAPPNAAVEEGAAWVSNELVLSTEDSTQHLVYTPDGWVVYRRTEHDPDDDPEIVGELAAMNATDLNGLRETRTDVDEQSTRDDEDTPFFLNM